MIEFLEGRKEETLSGLPLSYGKFLFSRLGKGQGLTLANTLRRILLYEFSSVGITSVSVRAYNSLDGTFPLNCQPLPTVEPVAPLEPVVVAAVAVVEGTPPTATTSSTTVSLSLKEAHQQKQRQQAQEVNASSYPFQDKSGFVHEFSSLPGLKESLFEVLQNLQSLVFENTFPYTEPQEAYLLLTPRAVPVPNTQSPLLVAVVGAVGGTPTATTATTPTGSTAGQLPVEPGERQQTQDKEKYEYKLFGSDISLPPKINLTFPSQHVTTWVKSFSKDFDESSSLVSAIDVIGEPNTIDTLSPFPVSLPFNEALPMLLLNLKIERISHIDIQNHSSSSPRARRKQDRLLLPIDGSLFPIKKVNYTIEKDANSLGGVGEVVFFEVWTNGSIHPSEAIHQAVEKSLSLFKKFI